MALESAGFISALVSTNPAASDGLSQGDDHLRLIKATLLATFPNFTAVALASTQANIDAAVTAANTTLPARFPVVTADIAALAVTTANIALQNVTTATIADANVTTAKIAPLAVTTALIADANVLTAKIADANVTYAKIQNVAANKLLGNGTGSPAAPAELGIGTGLVVFAGNLTAPAFPPKGAYTNKSIKVASNTTVTVSVDAVTMSDGTNYLTKAVSGTVNLGTNGGVLALDAGSIAIDTWYAIWAFAKPDGTVTAAASTSFSAPALPSGYTMSAYLGAVQTIHASATLYGTWQLGRIAQYVVGLAQTTALPNMANGTAGTYSLTTPSWAAVSVARFSPPTATRIGLVAVNGWNGNAVQNLQVAPNNSYGGGNSANQPTISHSSNTYLSLNSWFLLESANIYWAATGAGAAVLCYGWEDNI